VASVEEVESSATRRTTRVQPKCDKLDTYNTPGQAAADRDSDRGSTAHDDLYHLLHQSQTTCAGAPVEHVAYDPHSDLLSTSVILDDLLTLDTECVAILQFMLTSLLWPNRLMGSVTPADLGRGLPKPVKQGSSERNATMNPANTYMISRAVSMMEGENKTLQDYHTLHVKGFASKTAKDAKCTSMTALITQTANEVAKITPFATHSSKWLRNKAKEITGEAAAAIPFSKEILEISDADIVRGWMLHTRSRTRSRLVSSRRRSS
jgi:hypothetical protein